MSNKLNYDTVVYNYKAAQRISTVPKTRMVGKDHIFDEDKSVKWNKEQVEINNKLYQTERSLLKENRAKAIKEAYEDVIAYLQQETGMKHTTLHKLFNYIRSELVDEDNYGIESFMEVIEDICDIFKED